MSISADPFTHGVPNGETRYLVTEYHVDDTELGSPGPYIDLDQAGVLSQCEPTRSIPARLDSMTAKEVACFEDVAKLSWSKRAWRRASLPV